ncbi:MAG: cysteine--tRNA ligase [Candidatus Kerfeldbacteria bacterium]|nr:cysteine--tRNA ligase [Candidatus Kerfeldbacteria bacterium]
MKLYNTLSKKLEDFSPLHAPNVGLYTCGPTVYNFVHLGNLRTYIFEDVLRRTLAFNGYQVKHVMNITDVGHLTSDADTGDDKLERSAQAQGKSATELAAMYTAAFRHDLELLNILPADVMPTATGTIDLQISLIKQLEERGLTYRISDGIYFDTAKFPDYGRLSGQKLSDKHAGARVEVNAEKRNPTDFALWKFSPADAKRQMEWPSPWGVGFPGWHIECSAMSMAELGEQFDVHTGGIDHIAVHHENEIAQSEGATGKAPFVKYWLHGEFLVLPDKRMGKSEGNFITLQDVITRDISPLAYRYLVLQAHYRQKLTFSWESLMAAQSGLKKLWQQISESKVRPAIGCAEFEARFRDAINDDLNTAKALAVLQEMLKSDHPWSAKLQSLSVMDKVLGLDLLGDHASAWIDPPTESVTKRLEQREAARREKQWSRADDIRQQLLAQGFEVVDTPNGQRLRQA